MKTLIITLLIFFQFGEADIKKEWAIIGGLPVNLKAEKAEIPLKSSDEEFTAVRFAFRGTKVKVHHAKITYANGEIHTIHLRKTYKSGNLSKVIDLKGGKRKISKVEVIYAPQLKFDARPIIEVWGKQ